MFGFPPNAILGLNNLCSDDVYLCFQIRNSIWEACGHQLMLQQWHQGGPRAPIGCFVSTNQTRGSVWILQIFAWGTWLVKEACGGQPLHHILFLSNTPTHPASPPPHPTKKKKKDLSERWDFFEFPQTFLPRSNKVTKRSSDGTTNHLSQSIQWTGRSGAWHLYAIIHAISICTVKGKDSALLLNGKGSRVWTFCCCGVTGHGMHATVHVIFHSSSQSASLGVWCT